jgi:hypothetical protein
MKGLQAGRIVNYVMKDGQARPLLVARAWGDSGIVNGVLFVDGSNDDGNLPIQVGPVPRITSEVVGIGLVKAAATGIWATSVHFDPKKKPGTWHWPEREQSQSAANVKAKGKEKAA